MMRHALIHNSIAPMNMGAGLLLRMRAWFTRSATVHMAGSADEGALNEAVSGDVALRDVRPTLLQQGGVKTAILFPFPIRGEALLVKLADQLRRNAACRAPGHDALLLTVSRRPRSRLTIDHDAYVEFDAGCATYRAVVEAEPETRITVETTDFDTVVQFVAQYVSDRPSDAVAMEAVS